jgi:hypothetical protein
MVFILLCGGAKFNFFWTYHVTGAVCGVSLNKVYLDLARPPLFIYTFLFSSPFLFPLFFHFSLTLSPYSLHSHCISNGYLHAIPLSFL